MKFHYIFPNNPYIYQGIHLFKVVITIYLNQHHKNHQSNLSGRLSVTFDKAVNINLKLSIH